MNGEVVYYFIYDVGASIDLKKVESKFGKKRPAEISTIHPKPPTVTFPTPFEMKLDDAVLETEAGSIRFSVTGKFFSIGVISVCLRTAFTVGSLDELQRYNEPKIKYEHGDRLDDFARNLKEKLRKDISDYILEMYEFESIPETYTIFCIVGDAPALGESIREISALLVNEKKKEDLSAKEMEDVTKYWYSYHQHDLAVVDWNAAFIAEPEGKYEDILLVLEIANSQLLELRTYDEYLDRVLDEAYDDVEASLSRRVFPISTRPILMELSKDRIAMTEFTDEIMSITKFFGDWYLAKIYMGISEKLRLKEWQSIVNDKLQTLSELYNILRQELEARRMLMLEAMIVLLFMLDIVLVLVQVLRG